MSPKKNNSFKNLSEFDNHQSIVYLNDSVAGLKGFIAFHKNLKTVPSFGATRFWQYESETDAIKDALRLSKIMSYKNAMAGLKYGGAKATIVKDDKLVRDDKFQKDKILKAYAQQLNGLSGRFVTGADVGLDLSDIKKMKAISKYIVGVKSNPEKYTAIGLLFSIETICKKVFNNESLHGRTFAIQGVGKVGHEFLKLVYKKAGKIYISDTNYERLKFIYKLFPKTVIVKVDKIQKQKVDIYMPCALSHALNKKAIKELNCKIIVGAANNQLESKDIADKLYNNGIFYGPDYIVNAGGLISVVDEYEHGNFNADRIERKVRKIRKTLEKIIKKSDKEKRSPARIADEMAEKIISKMK